MSRIWILMILRTSLRRRLMTEYTDLEIVYTDEARESGEIGAEAWEEIVDLYESI